jgi:DNA polymerase (family 10)
MKLPLHNKLTNKEISDVFSFIAQVLGMDERNRFRARAYEGAAVVVAHLKYELKDRFTEISNEAFLKELDELPGIGEAISQKLLELFQTGDITAFEKYAKNLPGGMYPLMQIHGIGAKRALALSQEFGLLNPETAIDELLTKAKHGQVSELPGFGEKSEQDLITMLEGQHRKSRIPYEEAHKIAEKIKASLEQAKLTKRVEFLGSLRRGAETVGDIDLGVATSNFPKVAEHIKTQPFVKRVLLSGEQLVSVIVDNGWQADIKLAPLSEWGSFIQHFTGDKQHNIMLREYALKKGFSLSEHGIKIKASGEVKTFESEEAFYNFLGLKLIPPAERNGTKELEKYAL